MGKFFAVQQRSFFGCLLAIALSSCGDKDLDDYSRAKVSEEISKLNAIVGTYRGMIISRATQRPLGSLALTLETDTRIVEGSNQAVSSRQASLKGSLAILEKGAPHEFIMPFAEGFYDSDRGQFQAEIVILRRNQDAFRFQLQGVVRKNDLSGSVQAQKYPDFGADFNLSKGETKKISPIVIANTPDAQPTAPVAQIWTGYVEDNSPPEGALKSASLILNPRRIYTEEKFVELFVPVKLVDVSVDFNERIPVPFPNSEWDLRTGNLHCENRGGGVDGHDLVLDCIPFRITTVSQGWNCRYQNNLRGGFISFSVRPKS